jgi:hypothetical protein
MREKSDQLPVCGSAGGRRRDPDFERLAVDPHAGRLSGPWLDMNIENGSLLAIADN